MDCTYKDNFLENHQGYKIIVSLIDNKQNIHIPYYKYNCGDTFITRVNLDDSKRMDRITLDSICKENLKKEVIDTLVWLYKNLWINFYTHGDLTNNNLIYQNNKLYIIDWIDRSSILPKNPCSIWYIFADIIDFINVFHEINIIDKHDNFGKWHDVIKEQELKMIDNENINIESCSKLINKNKDELSLFFNYLRDISCSQINIYDLLKIMHSDKLKGGKNNTCKYKINISIRL